MSSSRGGYSLFIGRIPKNIRVRELEDIFSRHGPLTRCDVKYSGTGSAFAFVDYEDKRDAEDAVRKENGRELNNYNIVVEWAKKPTKPGYGDRDGGRGGGSGKSYGDRDRDRNARSAYDSRGASDRDRGAGGDRRRRDDDYDEDRTDRRRRRTRSPDDSPDKTSKRRRSQSPARNGKDGGDASSKEKEHADKSSPTKDTEVDSNTPSTTEGLQQHVAEDKDVPTGGEEKEMAGGGNPNGNGQADDSVADSVRRPKSGSPNVEGSPHQDAVEEAEASVHEEEEKNGVAQHSPSPSHSASRSPST